MGKVGTGAASITGLETSTAARVPKKRGTRNPGARSRERQRKKKGEVAATHTHNGRNSRKIFRNSGQETGAQRGGGGGGQNRNERGRR